MSLTPPVGWLLWGLLSVFCLAAGQRWGRSRFGGRGFAERFSVGLVISLSLLVFSVQLVGTLGLLRPIPLAAFSTILFGLVLLRGWRRLDLEETTEPLGQPLRDGREPLLGAIPFAVLVLAASGVMVWIFKSWNWDATAYHLPIINDAIETGGLAPVTSPMGLFVGFPRNGELLGIWNCIFPRDNRLDDSQQLPFCLLGWSLVAAWMRHLGSSRAQAAGVGAAFLLIPAVFLQAAHAQVDIACAVLLTGAIFFATRSLESRDRWIACLCLGLYLGTKFSGAFHLALLAPVLGMRAGWELLRASARGLRSRLRCALDLLASACVIPLLGGWQYVQNLRVHGNPVYPFNLTLLGHRFPGLYDAGPFYGAPRGTTGAFFGAPGDVKRLLTSLVTFDPMSLFPDVRTGGFGPAFIGLLLPAAGVWACSALCRGKWHRVLPILLLLALGLAVPAAHWARFSLAAAIAALVGFGGLLAQLEPRAKAAARALSAALLVLLVGGLSWSVHSLWRNRFHYGWPLHLAGAWHATAEERSTLQLTSWLWPKFWAEQRERELRTGNVVAYDESQDFLSEYATRDYRTRTVFVSSQDAGSYVARLRQSGARWAGVREGSESEGALQRWGAERLFKAPRTGTQLYRLPRMDP